MRAALNRPPARGLAGSGARRAGRRDPDAQYAPVALVLLAIVFLRTRLKLLLALAAAGAVLRGRCLRCPDLGRWPVHSYVTNLRFNLMVGGRLSGAGFAAYRYLSRAPGVDAVWQIDRSYASTPGYYYLHRAIPLYDAITGRGINQDLATVSASVSHLVAAVPDLTVPG